MPAIKPIKEIAEKWTRVTPGRAEDYRIGVTTPRKDWGDETAAAEGRYKAGVSKAATEGRFGKGVKKAGTDKWKKKTLAKGPTRFSEGVMIAGPDYEEGFGPYADVIARTELPPRGAKGDPANIARVAAIAKALYEKKIAG
jgi:hypothetical protein